MKVIFIRDVKGQGKKDEIKEVSDGYANNYLIKNKYAVKYTKTSLDVLEHQKTISKIEEENKITEATKIKEKLEKERIIIKVKAGKNDKIFGTISTKQIIDILKEKKYNVDKKNINIATPINCLGNHKIDIIIYKKVIASLTITLIKDSDKHDR
ncbi:MAG: 50S ribosomal protein L9 [bacterium]|nr:50S ribosomal protein L9 [bacterium]